MEGRRHTHIISVFVYVNKNASSELTIYLIIMRTIYKNIMKYFYENILNKLCVIKHRLTIYYTTCYYVGYRDYIKKIERKCLMIFCYLYLYDSLLVIYM